MQVTAYPPFRRLLGADAVQIDLPNGTTVRELLRRLGETHPTFRQLAEAPSNEFLWQHLIVHVDDEIAGLDTLLRHDDRLEFLPTIAGGAQSQG